MHYSIEAGLFSRYLLNMNFSDFEVLIVSLLLSGLMPIVHVLLIHTVRSCNGFRSLIITLTLLASTVTFLVYGRDSLIVWSSISIFGFFSLGYAEFYSMLCRGFSLTVMCDLAERTSAQAESLYEGYAGGQGMDWFFEKRIEGLQKLHLIRRSRDSIQLSSGAARAISKISLIYKSVLRLSQGG